MEKMILKNGLLRVVVQFACENGWTEKEFLAVCEKHFHDFEKGKKTTEEYWLARIKSAFEPELLLIRNLKKSESQEDIDVAEELRDTFRFRKVYKDKKSTATGAGRGRQKSPEKIAAEIAAQEAEKAIREKLAAVRAERLRAAAASLASETKRNEFDMTTSNPDAFLPMIKAGGELVSA